MADFKVLAVGRKLCSVGVKYFTLSPSGFARAPRFKGSKYLVSSATKYYHYMFNLQSDNRRLSNFNPATFPDHSLLPVADQLNWRLSVRDWMKSISTRSEMTRIFTLSRKRTAI